MSREYLRFLEDINIEDETLTSGPLYEVAKKYGCKIRKSQSERAYYITKRGGNKKELRIGHPRTKEQWKKAIPVAFNENTLDFSEQNVEKIIKEYIDKM